MRAESVTQRTRVLGALTTAFVLSIGSVTIAAAEPAALGRTEKVVDDWGGIEVRQITLDSPMLPSAGPQPPQCQKISYLRYRLTDGPADPEQADAVLVMQPGATGSASSLDRVARNTLNDLKNQGKRAEWWSIARRGVCQQDDTGIEAAVAARDYHVAVDYYYNNKEIDGKRFAGFRGLWGDKQGADFGLAQTVVDMNELLVRELPDREFRKSKTLCGGHSQGGLITGIFGAWDFTGRPQDAGFNQCAGFVALDTVVTADVVGLKVDPLLSALSTVLTGLPYDVETFGLKLGLLPNDNALIPVFNPKSFNAIEIAGLAARFAPDEETDLTRILPQDWQLASTFRTMSSPNLLDAVTGANGLTSFRYTNEAYLGAIMDDNAMTIGLDQTSLGTLDGPVAEKSFPVPGEWGDQLTKVPFVGPLAGNVLAATIGHGKRIAPTDHNRLYRWKNYRETPTTPWTDPSREVVDIRDFARSLTGPLGFTEIYFPTKVLYDTFFALGGTRSGDLAPIRYEAQLRNKPMITINGDKSVVNNMLDLQEIASQLFTGAPHFERVMLPGYTHIDTLAGAEVQNDGRPDPAGLAIAGFVDRTVDAER